jgi:PTH1 family peptidyl-tRNA hydrolase
VKPLIIVGLGNPGSEYRDTRHNIGFLVLDELATRLEKGFKPGKGEYLLMTAPIGIRHAVLVKPTTYMNNSGLAVIDVLSRYSAGADDLLVVGDDFALPLGTLRLRARGSDGGHNGLYSVIYNLGSDSFPRLRCGIGKQIMPAKHAMQQFVLSPFDRDEREVASAMVVRAADAVTLFATSGITRTMDSYNS